MKKAFFALLFCFSVTWSIVSADQISDKQTEITDLEKKVVNLQSQAKTLTEQIAAYDSQIKLALLKINQSEEQIASVSARINQLEEKLREKSVLLEKQIVQTYKSGSSDPLQLLFGSTNFNELVSQVKYLQIVQAQNRKYLHDTQLVQTSYAKQKELIEDARKRLQIQKKSLDVYRKERDNVLKQTKNNESLYQRQLEQARLELETIQKALVNAVKEGPVKAGDVIGLMGNSGYPYCSSGSHLHFEVRKDDTWVSAESYLKNMTDKWGMNIGSGNWNWPMQGAIEITQRYGRTDYSYRYKYSGGIHTGIDMVSSDKTVRAVADGTLYSSSEKCASATINLKYIDHGNGIKTLYLHLQ
ncbi:MAG: peptidoglycan DD-metalloendopeptidase family protein [Candidatus Amesbacteria bacterium]|nr:peptidoglycan DD-metalloendopeptidase family protein [Candidatus Amesbacteria bacterium]